MPRSVHPPHEVRAWMGEVLGERPRTVPMPPARETWVAEADPRRWSATWCSTPTGSTRSTSVLA